MSFTVIITSVTKDQTEKAYNYYETQQEGLGERFLQTLEKQYQKLVAHPRNYSFLTSEKDLRYLIVPRFPFIVVFQIKEQKVFIITVHNTHQDQNRIYKESD